MDASKTSTKCPTCPTCRTDVTGAQHVFGVPLPRCAVCLEEGCHKFIVLDCGHPFCCTCVKSMFPHLHVRARLVPATKYGTTTSTGNITGNTGNTHYVPGRASTSTGETDLEEAQCPERRGGVLSGPTSSGTEDRRGTSGARRGPRSAEELSEMNSCLQRTIGMVLVILVVLLGTFNR